ncbi:metallopeptidase TldD-related protein [Alkaliphilus transvaalensis]|uniref:metallopeptidase TldD-related protein n=1 Tax=Alkaliphilus transvaalensis TaxID=114628 RepID=UPI000479C400|nr:metallopeptidase TldD-related protein [Alkaliphilus transvaalensis]
MLKEKYISKVKETSVNVVQSRIESVRKKEIVKTSLRLYKDGYIGCSGAIGKYDEKELEAKAAEGFNNKISYHYELKGNLSRREDLRGEIIREEQIIEEFEGLLREIRKEQPDFYFSNKLKIREHEYQMINDNGLDLSYLDKAVEVSLIFKEKSSINIMDGFVGFDGRKYNRKLTVDLVNQICGAYKNKVDLPKKEKIPVIFSTGEEIIYRKLMQDLNGNIFGTGSSILSGKSREKLFNDGFSLYQTKNFEDTTLVPFFDAEGTVNHNDRFALIENGVFIAPYTDKKVANKYNLPLSGAATAQYDGVPTIGYPNLKIKESAYTAKELLGGQLGVLVMVASGGDFTPQGNFGSPVQLAFLFDGEKMIGRLPELTISSNLFDMFGKDFVGVSKDTIGPLSNERYFVTEMNVSKI